MNSRLVPDADGSGGRHAEPCGCDAAGQIGEVRKLIKRAYHGGGLPLTIANGARWMQWADT